MKAHWALVGAAIIDSEALADVRDILSADDLAGPAAVAFEAICALEDTGQPVSIPGVVRYIEAGGTERGIEDVGAFKGQLVRSTSIQAPGNLRALAVELRAQSIQRRLSEYLYLAYQRTHDPASDLGQLFDEIEDGLVSLRPAGMVEEVTAKEAARACLAAHEDPRPPEVVETGLSGLDRLVKLEAGRLVLIAGRPGMGKTALALDIARRAASLGAGVHVSSLEMAPGECFGRILAAEARVDSRALANGTTPDHLLRRVPPALGKVADLPIVIADAAGQSVFGLSSIIRRAVSKGARLAVVDYLGLVSPAKGQPKEQWARKGENARHFKTLAQKLKIPILLLVQVNQRVEQRQDKRPTLGDLHGSGELAMHADAVIGVYRDAEEEDGTAEALILKNRAGALGRVTLKYQPAFNRFDNLIHPVEAAI